MMLTVLNPVAQQSKITGSSAKRLESLAGKHIGLYWNHKPGGDAALMRAADLLKEKYPDLITKLYVGSIGGAYHQVTKDDVKRIADECVAVIGSTAD